MSEDAYPEFRWREHGRGTPVLLLHGLMGQPDQWEPTLRALGRICRAMALELPIFHPGLPEASIPELVRHVRAFLDAVGARCAVLSGNSLGGHVALQMALTYPDRVAGLILTGSSGLFERSFAHGVPHRPKRERVPTLIVWGRDDRITPPEVAHRFQALIPESKLVFIRNCGRAPMIERPDAFNEVALAWLVETGLRRAAPEPLVGAAR